MRHRKACGDGCVRDQIHDHSTILSVLAPAVKYPGGTGHADKSGSGAVHGKTIDEERAIALIESSAGTQQSYQVGDYIDDWEIVGIDLLEVTFSRGEPIARLPLEGKLARLAVQAQDTPKTAEFEATMSAYGCPFKVTVNVDRSKIIYVIPKEK